MPPTLTFLGAAQTVTGSKHLLDLGQHRILIDCGLFQGLKPLRLRNWEPFPVDPSSLDAVILTHAHLDHCGYLPRLVAQGFKGRVFCTSGTRDLCTLILADSAHIQEEDARRAATDKYSRHDPVLPLYSTADAARAIGQLQPVGYEQPVPVAPGVEVEFINAGHLLGSAYARVRIGARTILFGGDLGRYSRPVLPDPTAVDSADVLLIESTYGDRSHEPDDDGAHLAAVINEAVAQGGKVVIPSFAIGRVEEVLYWLHQLEAQRKIPALPVYVDSPMAARALTFYEGHRAELDPDLSGGGRRLAGLSTSRLTIVASPKESIDIARSRKPSIVIAASGMATGGRVLNHLEAVLPDPRNAVLFAGYQAAGTRGRLLCDGAPEIKMHGRIVPVAAQIKRLDSMSAHADANEMMRWLSHFTKAPSMTYLVHGEPPALDALGTRITAQKGWPVHIARYLEKVELNL